jgi:uncharacterized membrane protein YphA (DoxX/SURF4 family)
MNDLEFESAAPVERASTSTVLILLALTAAIFSYLGAFAMVNALIAAEVIKPWPRDHDPRWMWFAAGFVTLMALFLVIGGVAKRVSARNLREIDKMEEE